MPADGNWQQTIMRIASGVFSSTAVYGLSGSVALEGKDLAVAVTLTDLEDDSLVWQGEYLEPEADTLELQRTIALDVYNSLQSRANLPKGSPGDAKQPIAPATYRTYLLGMDKLRSGEPFNIDEAITLFNRALEQEPQFSEALAATCRAFMERYWYTRSNDDFEKGKAQCEEAQELEPDNSSVQLGLGEIAVVSGELSKAEYHYSKSIELDPGNVDALMGLARVAAERGDVQSAEALYVEATERQPTYWRTHNKLGTFYYIQGLYAKATEAYLRFTQLAPTNANAFSNLGAARFSAGDFEGAIEAWAKANEASPLSTSYTNTGVALYHMERMDEAIHNFEIALEMEPEDHFLWGNLGDALRVTKTSHDRTIATYSRARELALADLDVNDKDVDTLARMAVYTAYLGDPSTAMDYAKRAERLSGENFYVLYDLGVANMILGNSEAREQYVQRALALGFPKVLYETDPQFK